MVVWDIRVVCWRDIVVVCWRDIVVVCWRDIVVFCWRDIVVVCWKNMVVVYSLDGTLIQSGSASQLTLSSVGSIVDGVLPVYN